LSAHTEDGRSARCALPTGSPTSEDPRPPQVYGWRPPREQAEALVRRRINIALQYQRDDVDLREKFRLRPILQRTTTLISGRPYLLRRWGVWVDEDPVGYVRTNYERTRMRFLPYGLSADQYLIDEEAEAAEMLVGPISAEEA
jgi:hypothetical protein